MSDDGPRLSDEHSGHFDALADHPLRDAGRAHDPDHDANAWRHLDEDPDRAPTLDDRTEEDARREHAAAGLSEDRHLYGDAPIAEGDHHLSPDLIDELHGGAEPRGQSSTAGITDNLETYGGKPLRSEPDTRDVWLVDDDLFMDDDKLREVALETYETLREGICNIVDTLAPRGTRMEDQREGLFWGLVNNIHYQVQDAEKRIKDLTSEIETLQRTAEARIRELGLEGASLQLEEKTDRLLAASNEHKILEMHRDLAAEDYFKDTHKVWAPRERRATHVSQTGDIASHIDSKEFLNARRNRVEAPDIPEGTVVLVTGTRTGPEYQTITRVLDDLKRRHPDMILLHGNAPGVQKDIAARWARGTGTPQVALEPDTGRHDKFLDAVKARDRQLLAARPDLVLSFTAPGEKLPWLHNDAVRQGIPAKQISERTISRQPADARQTADTSHAPGPSQALPESRRTPTYAGVGARATPNETLTTMTAMSDWLGKRGWQLRSGGAKGADDAFAKGADAAARTVLLPWEGYNGREGADCVVPSGEIAERAREIAASLHPAWEKCDNTARSLHARNAAIVLGPDLDSPADALVCWTEDGKTVGGTGMAIRIAEKHGVPVFNLATLHPREICKAMTALEEQAAMRRDNEATAGAGLAEAAAAYTAPANDADLAERIHDIGERLATHLPPLSDWSAEDEHHASTINDLLAAAHSRPDIAACLDRLAETPTYPPQDKFFKEIEALASTLHTAQDADPARKATPTEQARADAFLASAGEDRAASRATYDALADAAFEALTESFNGHDATHNLGIHDVAHGTGDVYHAGDKVGFIERVLLPGQGHPVGAHLLQLDRDPGREYVIPPGKDPAAETQAILDRPPVSAAVHLSSGRDEDHARKARPHEQAIADAFPGASEPASRPDLSPSQALDAFVESILPKDNQLSEDTARAFDDQLRPHRKMLVERIIGAAESVIPAVEDEFSKLRNQAVELDHANAGSEIDLNNQHTHADRAAYTSESLATLHPALEELRAYHSHETGERYTPPAPEPATEHRHVTAASAEASNLVHDLKQARYQARLPAGRPLVVTALDSAATRDDVFQAMDKVLAKHPDIYIAHSGQTHGGAGVLGHAAEWARNNKVEQVAFHPDWNRHGNAAIPKRDLDMLKLDPIGILEFNDGTKPTVIAQEVERLDRGTPDRNRVFPVRSSAAKLAIREQEQARERPPAETRSRDHGREMGAQMSW